MSSPKVVTRTVAPMSARKRLLPVGGRCATRARRYHPCPEPIEIVGTSCARAPAAMSSAAATAERRWVRCPPAAGTGTTAPSVSTPATSTIAGRAIGRARVGDRWRRLVCSPDRKAST